MRVHRFALPLVLATLTAACGIDSEGTTPLFVPGTGGIGGKNALGGSAGTGGTGVSTEKGGASGGAAKAGSGGSEAKAGAAGGTSKGGSAGTSSKGGSGGASGSDAGGANAGGANAGGSDAGGANAGGGDAGGANAGGDAGNGGTSNAGSGGADIAGNGGTSSGSGGSGGTAGGSAGEGGTSAGSAGNGGTNNAGNGGADSAGNGGTNNAGNGGTNNAGSGGANAAGNGGANNAGSAGANAAGNGGAGGVVGPICGDGKIDPGEECDTTAGATALLRCNASCKLDCDIPGTAYRDIETKTCYFAMPGSYEWDGARKACAEGGKGRLATFEDVQVRKRVHAGFQPGGASFWVGARQEKPFCCAGVDDDWKWKLDASSPGIADNAWSSDEPNDKNDIEGGEEDCGEALGGNGFLLNDSDCKSKRDALCQRTLP